MHDPHLEQLIGRSVVLDMRSTYVFLGKLTGQDEHYLILEEVDVHDLRDTTSTREFYILEARTHGIRANRKRALVTRADIVSISTLKDVIE